MGTFEPSERERAALQLASEQMQAALKRFVEEIIVPLADKTKELSKLLCDLHVMDNIGANMEATAKVLRENGARRCRREMLEALPDSRMKHFALHAKQKRIRKKYADRLLRRE